MFKLIAVCLCLVFVSANEQDQFARTVTYVNDVEDNGAYNWRIDTTNDIHQQESGVGGVSAVGAANWVSPEGIPVEFSYVADQNGYQPRGSHIHAIPPLIARALDYIRRVEEYRRAHPEIKY